MQKYKFLFGGPKIKKEDTTLVVSSFLELLVGIEPTTFSLRVRCSAIEPQ